MGYVTLREAVKRLGLHPNTLRKYADNGSIPSIRSPAGQCLFDVDAYLGASSGSTIVFYYRVSSYNKTIGYLQHLDTKMNWKSINGGVLNSLLG